MTNDREVVVLQGKDWYSRWHSCQTARKVLTKLSKRSYHSAVAPFCHGGSWGNEAFFLLADESHQPFGNKVLHMDEPVLTTPAFQKQNLEYD